MVGVGDLLSGHGGHPGEVLDRQLSVPGQSRDVGTISVEVGEDGCMVWVHRGR